jgi:hypothetical protein
MHAPNLSSLEDPVTSGAQYKLCRSSLCAFLRPPASSRRSAPRSQIPSVSPSLNAGEAEETLKATFGS